MSIYDYKTCKRTMAFCVKNDGKTAIEKALSLFVFQNKSKSLQPRSGIYDARKVVVQ